MFLSMRFSGAGGVCQNQSAPLRAVIRALIRRLPSKYIVNSTYEHMRVNMGQFGLLDRQNNISHILSFLDGTTVPCPSARYTQFAAIAKEHYMVPQKRTQIALERSMNLTEDHIPIFQFGLCYLPSTCNHISRKRNKTSPTDEFIKQINNQSTEGDIWAHGTEGPPSRQSVRQQRNPTARQTNAWPNSRLAHASCNTRARKHQPGPQDSVKAHSK